MDVTEYWIQWCYVLVYALVLLVFIAYEKVVAILARRAGGPRCCRCRRPFAEGQRIVTVSDGGISHVKCAVRYYRRQRGCAIAMGGVAGLLAAVSGYMIVKDLKHNLAVYHELCLSEADFDLLFLFLAAFIALILVWYWRRLRVQENVELGGERAIDVKLRLL